MPEKSKVHDEEDEDEEVDEKVGADVHEAVEGVVEVEAATRVTRKCGEEVGTRNNTTVAGTSPALSSPSTPSPTPTGMRARYLRMFSATAQSLFQKAIKTLQKAERNRQKESNNNDSSNKKSKKGMRGGLSVHMKEFENRIEVFTSKYLSGTPDPEYESVRS
jgi:hypothetical protein